MCVRARARILESLAFVACCQWVCYTVWCRSIREDIAACLFILLQMEYVTTSLVMMLLIVSRIHPSMEQVCVATVVSFCNNKNLISVKQVTGPLTSVKDM